MPKFGNDDADVAEGVSEVRAGMLFPRESACPFLIGCFLQDNSMAWKNALLAQVADCGIALVDHSSWVVIKMTQFDTDLLD